ncbi:MAG TPA: hypothetical protein VF458_20155 [Ktedonobacteraceae bacterium]
MIDAWDAWSAKRAVRLLLATSMLAGGCVATVLLIWQRQFSFVPICSTIGLAALVGSEKQATP